MVEVLIAGAGPAGACAAIVLARAGLRVLLVDRARFPRPKLCGDTLNPGALALLDELGLRPELDALGLDLDGMRVTSGRGLIVTGQYRGHSALAITRSKLDHLLLQAAVRAGAQVEEGVRVIAPIIDVVRGVTAVRGAVLQTTQGPLRIPAAWTIAADGRRSSLALSLQMSMQPETPRRWAVGAYYTDVDGMSSFGEMHIRRGHYIGVAPLPEGVTNACVVSADRRKLARPAELLQTTLNQDPLLRERFAAALQVSAPTCIGPLAVDSPRCGMNGLLLAGDAAGFIDPMTGDGLRFAIRGGTLAAEAVVRAFDRSPVPAHRWLATARRREFSQKQRLNRLLRRFVGTEACLVFGEWGARFAPAIVRGLIRASADLPHRPIARPT